MNTKIQVLIGLCALGAIVFFGSLTTAPIVDDETEASCSSVEEGPESGVQTWAISQPEQAPLKASTESRIKAWWARLVAVIRAAIGGDDNTPADPVTPVPGPVTPAPDPVTPTPVPSGDNSFLWKPVSDTRGGVCCVITPANLEVARVLVNGANETKEKGKRANGNRQHFWLNKSGAAYGSAVKVQAVNAAGVVLKSWTVPKGDTRWSNR